MNTRVRLLPTNSAQIPIVDGITIDGPDSMDLDDAVWLDEVDGLLRLTVSIADVADSIPINMELDLLARKQGYTRYYARGNAPMLPHHFSEDKLSLLRGQLRRVLCVQIVLDAALDPIEITGFHAHLTVSSRLRHAQVQTIVENERDSETCTELGAMLTQAAILAGRLLEKRRMRGELAFYDLLSGWTLSEEGGLRKLQKEERNIGYVVVQELMILANRTVAEMLLEADVPALFRNHTVRAATPERKALLTDIQAAVSHTDVFDIETLQKRLHLLLGRARYGPDLLGHFGLNLPAYLHFTSPIRRYADLVNHRVLSALLHGMPPPYSRAELTEIGDHLNRLRDEEIERKNQSYRRRAAAVAKSMVHAEPNRIVNLSSGEVYRVLEASIERDEPPEALIQAVEARIVTDKISLKEVFFLLFQSPHDSEEWVLVRLKALEWLTNRPFHAVSLIVMGVETKAWAALRCHYGEDGGNFLCNASVVWGADRLESGVRMAGTKKGAQQRAVLALCYRMLGVPLPAVLEQNAPAEITPKCKAGPKVSRPQQRRNSAAQRAQELAGEGDCVSAIWLLLNSLAIKLPRVIYRVEKEAGDESVHCRMSALWEGNPVEYEGIGSTRQQAKQRAAHSLWQRIQSS